MALSPTFVPAGFSVAAVFAWGASDFIGGYAARRTNAFLLTTFAHASGALFMMALALATHAPLPSHSSLLWAMAAGLSGGSALALFYRALASGHMGLTAPVAAVLGAAIPVLFGVVREGFPGTLPVVGFLLATVGIWLISRPEGNHRPEGIGLALLSGVGFAGYFLLSKQAGDGSALWIAGFARVAGFMFTSTIVLFGSGFRKITPQGLGFGIMAGMIDVSGSALYVRATQTGRLDSAVVISSLYPAVTVLLARFILKEHLTRWKAVGMLAALIAVPLIAM